MRLKRGSFAFRLFSVSAIVGVVFSLISIVVNDHFIRKIVIRTVEDRAISFLDYAALMLNGPEMKGINIDPYGFFHNNEFYKLSLFSENGILISEKKGIASFDENYLPDLNNIKPDADFITSGDKNYYSFIKRISFSKEKDSPVKQKGFLILSLNLNNIFEITGSINKFRIVFFTSQMVVLIIFVYFIAKILTNPFNRLLLRLEEISKGNLRDLGGKKSEYEELNIIINNYNRIMNSLNSVSDNLILSEERLSTFLKKSKDVILVINERFKIKYASQTFKKITGLEIDENKTLISLSEFLSQNERKKLIPVLRKILRGKGINDFELKITDINGDDIYLLTSWVINEDDQGNLKDIIILGKNITDHKNIADVLKKRTEALETILFSLSHDIKSPVFTLKGMTLLFKQKYYDSLDEQGKHFIDRIDANTKSLERMISHLLDISRFERQTFKNEVFNLNEVIWHLLSDMKDYIQEADAIIEVEDNLPTIAGDREKIYIAFKNLLENSLKYRSPNRQCKISIKQRKVEKGVEIIMEDNGIGIENKYLDKLFKPFSRAISNSEGAPKGYGIGLAIVKGIMDAHNAEITVASSYGEWTRFKILFNKT